MNIRRAGLIALCAVASVDVFAQQQSELPQFRAAVELVQLDVAVLDDKRQPVRGLTAADFSVLEEGVARPIRAFTAVDLPARTTSTETAWSKTVQPDVVSNQVGEQEGRIVVILMDRSIPLQQPTIVARRVATAAIDALGPSDLAAVVSTSNGAVQNLTSDRTRLLRAINHGDPSTGIAPEQQVGTLPPDDPMADGRCLCGLCVLETITRVAEAVQDTPRRRKVLLFIGSNLFFQWSRPVAATGQDTGCETPLKDARNAMFAAVDRANLTVHSIDPQGLVNIGNASRAGVSGGGLDIPSPLSGPNRRLNQFRTETTETISHQQNLKVLPERTGGRTVVGANNPEEAVPAIFRESEAYYVIGFERGTANPKDVVRSIEVKVGRKGLRVTAQRSYVVPPSASGASPVAAPVAPSTPDEALSRLLPSARKPLAISVTPFASPDASKAIARVNVDARAFAREDAAVPLLISVMAVDPTGKVVASASQTSTVSAAKSTAANVNVQSHLELAPGEYEIRAAVSDPASNAVASVFSDVSIPKFASVPLSVSGVMVDVAGSATATPAATTRRAFRRGERVRALMQIYQGTERTEAIVPVSMRVQILDAKGGAVRDQSLPFAEQAFTNRRADCVITLPLSSLPPGDYLLKLEASADRHTAGRALRFAVE